MNDQHREIVYNVGTLVAMAAFLSTAVDGVSNLRRRTPNTQVAVFAVLALCASLLRVPLLLSDIGTQRERLMFLGYLVLEAIACGTNLSAYRTVEAYAATAVIAPIAVACIVLLARRLMSSS